MPYFRLETNVPQSKIPSDLPQKLCTVISKSLGKPINYCVAAVIGDVNISWNGSTEPAAQASLLSVGSLGVEENKKHSKILHDLISKELNIPPDSDTTDDDIDYRNDDDENENENNDDGIVYHHIETPNEPRKHLLLPEKTTAMAKSNDKYNSPQSETDNEELRDLDDIYFQVKTPPWSSTTPSPARQSETLVSQRFSSSVPTKSESIGFRGLLSSSVQPKHDLDNSDPEKGSDYGSKEETEDETGQRDYTNFSVLSIHPGSPEQLNEILEFEYKGKEYDFWSHKRMLLSPLIVLLPPKDTELRTILREHKVDYMIQIENVQTVFEYERIKSSQRMHPSLTGISFNMYLRYDFIMEYLKHLSKKYWEIARVIKIGKTIENRDIAVLEVKDPLPPEHTIGAVVIEAGMHGREWLGVSAALYVINQLVEHASANEDMFDGLFWYILPVFNADGYEYAHSSDRLWKNNRRKYANCTGVDLDRNFDFLGDLHNKPPINYNCTNIYSGKKPGSEPEIRALKRFLKMTKNFVKVYISLHSGDPFIGYPWAYKSERSADYENLVELAMNIKAAIEEVDNSTKFIVHSLYSLCGIYDGAAVDWAKRKGILYPLMVSLKGGEGDGFDVPSDYIYDAVVSTFEGIRAISKYLHLPENQRYIARKTEPDDFNNSSTIRFFVVVIILMWLIISVVIS